MTEDILEGIAHAVCSEIEKALKEAFMSGYESGAILQSFDGETSNGAWLEYINGDKDG